MTHPYTLCVLHTQTSCFSTQVFEYSLAPKDPKPIGFSWSPPAPRPLGRGRGKGRGLAAMQLPPRAPSPSEPETETATETETEGPMTAEKKRERDIRKLRKMLRQVSVLVRTSFAVPLDLNKSGDSH